ncbi:MAG: hypothetical protein EOO11_19445 [Chitinophagaceae bacterium]|nr:MAG: hypothetical protein EOO11_19445 [Chitinophagaceae bacterium]
MCLKARKYAQVEVQVRSLTNPQISFPTDSIVNQAKRIMGIEAYKIAEVSAGKETGNSNVADAVFAKASLNLATSADAQPVSALPLARLNAASNGGRTLEFDLDPLTLAKCSISLPASSLGGLTANTSFILGFFYE